MNFTAYIERQKSIIRDRHEGDIFLYENGDCIPVTESDKLFVEQKKSKVLNPRVGGGYRCAVLFNFLKWKLI